MNRIEAMGVLVDDNGINKHSSRSHSALKMSQLSFKDLAGSERRISTSTKLDKKIEEESIAINDSLQKMNMVLEIKAKNQECTYRYGPLPQMMAYFFEHPGSIKYLVCLSPQEEIAKMG